MDLAQPLASGDQTAQAPAVPEGSPAAIFSIDGHSIGIAFSRSELSEGPAPTSSTASRQIEGVDCLERGIGVVERSLVKAEGRAVGGPEASVNVMPGKVDIETVK